ncbi:MAG: hypothetical protein KDH88_15290 [Chromatiales bacterium]|nr:hypothetical protein [Chromatiales bacterium]
MMNRTVIAAKFTVSRSVSRVGSRIVLLLLLPMPAFAAPPQWFDGIAHQDFNRQVPTPGITLSADQASIPGDALRTIEFVLATRWDGAAVLAIHGIHSNFVVGLGEHPKDGILEFMSGVDIRPIKLGLDRTSGAPHHIALVREADGRWTVYADGQAKGSLPKEMLEPAADEPLSVEIGGVAFSGVIAAFRLWSQALTPAQVGSVGAWTLKPRSEPEGLPPQRDLVLALQSGELILGKSVEFKIPFKATQIRVQGEANAVFNWKRIFSKSLPDHPQGSTCIKTWGTVGFPQSGPC